MTTQEYQPATSAFETNVQPDTVSGIILSGGRTIPFLYYLGANSTAPLVRLESPTTSKELTWGDVVELPPGVAVSVRNISYMPGDVQIQSGRVPAPSPRRITVPVSFDAKFTVGDTIELRPHFPCDTRRARRAYFAWGVPDIIGARVRFILRGFNQQHSGSQQAGLPVYTDLYEFNTVVPEFIPLGTSMEGNGMRLADFVRLDAEITAAPAVGEPDHQLAILEAFYVLEY